MLFSNTVQAQQNLVDIPDYEFREYLKTQIPTAFVGDQMDANHNLVTSSTYLNLQNVGTIYVSAIKNLEGLQYFTGLKSFIYTGTYYTSPVKLTIPALPNSLDSLYLTGLDVATLPALPTSLTYLSLNNNKLTGLSALPNTLLYLNCNTNKLTNLPALPNSLTTIECYNNQLATLPSLPNSLTAIYCHANQLTTLPNLPSSLTTLGCTANHLTALPTLPSLKFLSCGNNFLSTLPSLPNSLENLYCANNQLTTLPTLPNSLTTLNCNTNIITVLPTLPGTLTELRCDSNQLQSLPALPASLKKLACCWNPYTSQITLPPNITHFYCTNYPLSSLPALPQSLTALYLYGGAVTQIPTLPNNFQFFWSHNISVKCLPFLPSTIRTVYCDSNFCLPNAPNSTFVYGKAANNPNKYSYLGSGKIEFHTKTFCSEATNPNNCPIFQKATGRVYIDINADGVYSAGIDHPCVHGVVNASPYTTMTDTAGMYEITFEDLNKDYTITPVIFSGYSVNPTNHTVNFPAYNVILSGKDFILTPTQTINDVNIQLTAVVRPRPGFDATYILTVKNTGTTIQNANVQYAFDNRLVYNSSNPSAALSSNTVSWTLDNFKPMSEKSYFVSFTLPSSVVVGTTITGTATISPIANDYTPNNNMYSLIQIVTASCDPNDKSINKGASIIPAQISAQEDFEYIVHFQNTGTDTAYTVVIRDTISTLFDLNTLQTVSASHNYSFKSKNNVAFWTFSNIKLPDSTIDKTGSNGFVKYTIKPLSTVPLGSDFKNTAYIGFDFNEDVVTNTTHTVVTTTTDIKDESQTSQIIVYPNPSKGLIHIKLGGKQAQLEISTITGNVIFEKLATTNEQIDLSKQKQGVYFLKIITDGKAEVKKLIIE